MPQPPSPRPALVLLPGLDGTGVMFEPLLRALGPDLDPRVVRYPPELGSYADCLAFARAQLPADRPFLLLGESFSGPVALALAAEAPEGLRGLVLCGTFARNPRPGLAWAAPFLRRLPPLRLSPPLTRRLLLDRWGTAALASLADRMLPTVPKATLKARLLAVLGVDHRALLGRVPVPTLLLRAAGDRVVPSRAAGELRAGLRRPDQVTLEGPHWLLQARPEAAARALADFMDRIGLPGEAVPRRA